MVTDKLKELEAARAKLASLELSIASELNKELASLPAKYGFASAEDFTSAVRAASGARASAPAPKAAGRRRGRPAGSTAKKVAAPAPSGGKRRKRAVITDETRTQVKKMVEGGKTGAEIAKNLGISLPSVQNIKKALGLVKER